LAKKRAIKAKNKVKKEQENAVKLSEDLQNAKAMSNDFLEFMLSNVQTPEQKAKVMALINECKEFEKQESEEESLSKNSVETAENDSEIEIDTDKFNSFSKENVSEIPENGD
jgi:hypothetical protein